MLLLTDLGCLPWGLQDPQPALLAILEKAGRTGQAERLELLEDGAGDGLQASSDAWQQQPCIKPGWAPSLLTPAC